MSVPPRRWLSFHQQTPDQSQPFPPNFFNNLAMKHPEALDSAWYTESCKNTDQGSTANSETGGDGLTCLSTVNPCQTRSKARKAAAEPQAGAWGPSPLKRNTSTERQTFPARLRPLRVSDKKHTKPYGKLPHNDVVCHWAAHHPQVKPLKTKPLDVDIKAETPKSRRFSPRP